MVWQPRVRDSSCCDHQHRDSVPALEDFENLLSSAPCSFTPPVIPWLAADSGFIPQKDLSLLPWLLVLERGKNTLAPTNSMPSLDVL